MRRTDFSRPALSDPVFFFFNDTAPTEIYTLSLTTLFRSRRLAAEGGIDLAAISPSGPHGRIVARDVEAAARASPKAAPRPAAAAAAVGVTPAAGPSAEEVKAIYRDVPFQ